MSDASTADVGAMILELRKRVADADRDKWRANVDAAMGTLITLLGDAHPPEIRLAASELILKLAPSSAWTGGGSRSSGEMAR